jgi:Rrf2 family nitric oxide-sensitive transcriptional repressor
MRLTRFSDIGLRVLMYLARASEQRNPATVAEIASQFDIPVNHLVKVVAQLSRTGWVLATRGRKGGLALGVDARTLKIGVVLRELEGEAELVDCEAQNCRLSHDCRLRGALAAGQRAFYEAMDQVCLADIVGGGTGEKIIVMHREFTTMAELRRVPAV